MEDASVQVLFQATGPVAVDGRYLPATLYVLRKMKRHFRKLANHLRKWLHSQTPLAGMPLYSHSLPKFVRNSSDFFLC